MKDSNTSKFSKINIWKLICLLVIIFVLLLRLYFRNNAAAAEAYVRNIYPTLTAIWRVSNNILPFSLSEVFVILLPLSIVFILIISTINLIKARNRKNFLASYLKKFLSIFLVLVTFFVSTFFLNFGFAYHRESLANNLKYDVSPVSVERLARTTELLVNELNVLADDVSRDVNGQFVSNTNLDELLKNIYQEYKHLAEVSDNDFLKNYLFYGAVRLKPVCLSHYWSYTGTTGMFMPFWMESNVNVDVSPDELIFTALHEIAHSYGFARENEANFLAFLVGRTSECVDIRYAAILNAFVYLSNALYSANYNLHEVMYSNLNDKVKIDLHRRNIYWNQFQGPVKKISNKANDIYLKSNAQESGIHSYGEVVDLIVAFYDKHETSN